MSYREVSEIRDGMRIDWDMPIKMDDGLVLRCDIYRPIEAGPLSGHPDAMARTANGCTSTTSTPSNGGACARSIPTCRPARPTSTSAGRWSIRRNGCRTATSCIRVDSRGAGRSPGVIDIWSLREAHGPRAMRRMGRRAAVVERQGRAQRHLLLRREPVAVRGAAAQAPRRDLPVGRRRRLLPRHGASRRHFLQRLHQGLVGARRSTRCSTGAARAASRAA